MFRLWLGVNPALARLLRRLSRLRELSGTTRWLLLAIVVVLFIVLGYAILRLSPYLEGFEQYGYLGAFFVSVITSSTVILPAPGFFVIGALAASQAFSWALVALASGVGGALGESTAYLAGYGGAVIITPEQSKWYKRAEDWMRRYGSVTIFIFSITWLPFDFVGIAAGALRFPFWKFLLATIAGRMPRTFLGCYLAYLGWELLPGFLDWLSGLAWWIWA
ncbi:MAG: VTT domain-containing protein, partial [Dehalococcoidia bacterium]|nr:VTT domain-containing protein [Dehalococcoidia bacterium]